MCTNVLWQPNIPTEFEAFKGRWMHSAMWDHSVDLKDKIVGIVGTGSSAVQLTPPIVEIAKQVHSFQRSPAWILPKPVFEYGRLQKWIFRHVPMALKVYRWNIFWAFERLHEASFPQSKLLKKG